jgi:urease accessory protein
MRDLPPDSALTATSFPSELLIWLSPSFPVGSFAYSQGLEAAVDRDWVRDRETLKDWITALVRYGALKNDLILISLIMRAGSTADLQELIELSTVLQPSSERAQEATDQGRNFVAAFRAGWAIRSPIEDAFDTLDVITFPAALAVAARARTLDPATTLETYAVTFCTNLLSAAIRLSVIGQFDGQRLMAILLPTIREVAYATMFATIDDLGSATYGADLASMFHETQTTRLFRS